MIILKGNNLGERQRELNAKVKEAASKRLDFERIKDSTEKSDVDKLFKIDLASKYSNIEYIIEVLKSGDSLYISRALKALWIFDDDYSNIINVGYLHDNVMPFMSMKMKKKLLTAISIHVRNEKRAAAFYQYCMDIKFTGIALKFLNFTSDTFKLELLQERSNCNHLVAESEGEQVKHFIGLSFTLADAYAKMIDESKSLQVFWELSYLFTVSDVKYLDLLEKYVVIGYNDIRLGLRISKSIMKKHKDRVLRKPSLYVGILSKSVLVKYSTSEDAKVYAEAVLPDDAGSFWDRNYYETYKFILDKIIVGKFEFLKQIFTAKYPGQEFEMNVNFYNKGYFKLMTAEERETWALKQIASGAEILGIGRDYMWYKFVNFERALEDIKKLIFITTDNLKRAEMMDILTESAKNQRDIEKLLKYYYARHVNEPRYAKENFVDGLIQRFNVYEFDDDCWAALNKMFYNLEVYSMTDYYNCKSDYKIVVLIYNIIKKTDIPESIKTYIASTMYFYILKLNTDKLAKEQQEMVFNFLYEFYMDEIRKYEIVPYDDDVKNHLRKYIYFILDILHQFERTKDDCPELLYKFMKLDWAEFECHRLIYVPTKYEGTRVDLLRDLKEDANLLIKNLPLLKTNIDNSYTYNISTVLKKIKIYFSDSIAKEYLKFFNQLLSEDQLWSKVAHSAAHGIFQLGDDDFKVEFMTKYAPKEPKINRSEIDEKLLRIQEAICSHACYSRPPVPLKYILMYIKGDYVHFCMPMFHYYLANLPLPLCMEFIEALLDTPVSIQKHGIRLAFECFNAESLNKLVLRVWNRTKNISLRTIIFKAVFNKISDDQVAQDMLFDTLKTITSTLRQEDDDELFGFLVSRKLPSHLMPEYIETAWNVVNQLPDKSANINRKRSVIEFIENNINLVCQDAVRRIVDSFIASVFAKPEEGDKKLQLDSIEELIQAKWDLTTRYIVNIRDKDDLDIKLELTKLILKECLRRLETGIKGNRYVLRELCNIFIYCIENKSYDQDFRRYEHVNVIMQYVLETLQNTLFIEEIYMLVWELRLGAAVRKVLADAKTNIQEDGQTPGIREVAINFAEELGNLIKEFIEKELYFASFSKDIEEKIVNKIQILKNQFDVQVEDEALIIVCFGLMQFEINEIYLLVLDLIPSSPEYEEDYKSIVDKFKKLDNKEIRCNLFKKFVNTDFQVRDFMHS